MAAMTASMTRRPQNFLLLILMLAMLFVFLAVAVQTMPHAVVRHGDEAIIARQCSQSPEYIFRNALTGRTALVCMTDIGKFGIVIIDQSMREITAFLKNKMTSIDQVVKYLANSGYH